MIRFVLSIVLVGSAALVGFALPTGSANTEIAGGAVEPQNAARIYVLRCASCHGRDGRANTRNGRLKAARDLTDAQWQADVSDERIFNSITNGRGKMPPYGKRLSEQVIESLVTYVRGLQR